MAGSDAVLDAIERWRERGLVDAETAALLRGEALEHAERSGRTVSRYALAVAGGLVLLVATGVLADLVWPHLDDPARSLVLAVTGVVVHAVGIRFESGGRWLPVAWVLQTAGLLVLLGAFLHSELTWADTSPAGVVVGVLALAVPLVTAPRALGRNAVMPAVHVALAPAFVAVFLDRATSLSSDAIVWTLDLLVALGVAALLVEVGRASRRGATERQLDARLHAFTVALYAGLLMAVLTAVGPLDLEEDVVWAVDAWWALVTTLTLWALHRAPAALRRGWYRRQLVAAVLAAVPLVLATCAGTLELGYVATALVLGAAGGVFLAYALATGFDDVLKAAALVVVVAAWYFGIQAGGAVGALLALLFTAVLLFWLSTQLADDETADA